MHDEKKEEEGADPSFKNGGTFRSLKFEVRGEYGHQSHSRSPEKERKGHRFHKSTILLCL
jgi:hypothetical protein